MTRQHYKTVLRHIASGHLQAVKMGPHCWAITPEALREYCGLPAQFSRNLSQPNK